MHHGPQHEHHGTFGGGSFGQAAERVAKFLGTPTYLVLQTIVLSVWAATGLFGLDSYPFLFMTLILSLQASYAAPFILLAATREAERDKARAEADLAHREQIAAEHRAMLQQVHDLLTARDKG